MVMNVNLTLVGVGRTTTAKGNEYLKLCFVQGADSIDFLVKDFAYEKAKLFSEYVCTLSYNTQYKRLNLESMRSV